MTHETPTAIIDHVPTASELQRDPRYADSSSIRGQLKEQWGINTEQDAMALNVLAGELTFAEPTGDRLKSLYDVSRHVGDALIAEVPQFGGGARNLLDRTRWEARPRTFAEISEYHKGSASGTHNEERREMTQDLHGMRQISSDLYERMKNEGMPLADITHASLAVYLSTAAHESGHAILSGISAMEKSVRPNDGRLLATSMFLAKHPEIGFTGDWEQDVLAHEERFAEGYAQMVLTEAMKTLGYSDEVNGKLSELLAPIVTDNNEWEKGYAAPLSKEALAAQLSEMDEIFERGETLTLPTETAWMEAVTAQQLEPIRDYVHGQAEAAQPQSELHAKRPRLLRRIGQAMLQRTTTKPK